MVSMPWQSLPSLPRTAKGWGKHRLQATIRIRARIPAWACVVPVRLRFCLRRTLPLKWIPQPLTSESRTVHIFVRTLCSIRCSVRCPIIGEHGRFPPVQARTLAPLAEHTASFRSLSIGMERMHEMKTTGRRHSVWGATMVVGLSVSLPVEAQDSSPAQISHKRALEIAKKNNPVLEAARQRILEAEGDLLTAGMLLVNNPALTARVGQRKDSAREAEPTIDAEVGLQQRFEIGGQRGHRIDRANASSRAMGASAENAHRVVALAVTNAFYDSIAADRRVRIREEGQKLAQRLLDVAARRLERGAGTPLELNTARIRHADAQRRLFDARATSRSAMLRVRQLLALPAERAIVLEGDLPKAELTQEENSVVARARKHRPDLRVAEHRVASAEAALALADAEAWPDISLGVSYGQEETSKIIQGSIRIPIPAFNRNQGTRARARATVSREQAEQAQQRLAVELEVRRAYADYLRSRDALRLYDAEVLRAQEESLSLLQRAFDAGDVAISDFIVVQRAVIEGREGYLDVRLAFARARALLLASTGKPQIPPTQGDVQ